MLDNAPSQVYGLVDMGSNGIRFSITNLAPKTARSLPTVFQDRAGISLYDAQYSTGQKGPIPQDVIDDVVGTLLRFKTVCADFAVSETNIRVLATEATRTAENSEAYRKQIKDATGWEVDMLPKEAEGRIGALGVASSFSKVEGLVMDLGGGSTQITWMIAEDGKVKTSPKGSFSFPYGAAAMTRKLDEISKQDNREKAEEQLAATMKQQFQDAFTDLDLPDSLQSKARDGGLTLYLSGGGFRGWGYLLMSQHRVSPYPIPIINGFHVTKRDFQNVADIQEVAAKQDVFRVSQRRAGQVPAVGFLVKVLVQALPMIQDIRFCQGGVREGFLFDALDPKTRAMDPLPAATAKFGSPSAAELAELLWAALPGENQLDRSLPASFQKPVIRAIADMMYVQAPASKETASVAALYVATTGHLASAHGVSHGDRAMMALMLCQRWDGELAPPDDTLQVRLRNILTQQEVFWCNYLGSVAGMVGCVYPAGLITRHRLSFSAQWREGMGKKGLQQGVRLTVRARPNDAMTTPAAINDLVDKIEKVGKKKNRVGGKEHGYGLPIEVKLSRDL